MKTLQEKAQYWALPKQRICDRCRDFSCNRCYIAVRNAFIAGYEAHCHETRWRSVGEELPEPNKKVLVKRNLDVFGGDPAEHQLCYLGKYDDGKIVWLQCETEQPACRITHWKPIE